MSPELMPTPPAHLLIVDDNPQEVRLLVELLRASRYRISVAFDGMQAYHRALAKRPDLILMDVRMPIATGFAACRRLQSDPVTRNIPVIFLTSSDLLEERLEGLECGGVDYVLKPFDPPEVLARIRIHLAIATRRASGESERARRDERMHRMAATIGVPDASDQSYAPGVHYADEDIVVRFSDVNLQPRVGPSRQPDADRVIVDAAKRYLSSHLANPPRREKLASQLGTYEKKLSQAFRKVEGLGLYEFIREERLRTARRLLAETSLSVTAIADEVGFSSGANFATAFREKFGVTPTAFRSIDGMAGGASDRSRRD